MANPELNRTLAPHAKPIDAYTLPPVEKFKLDNGITVYSLQYGNQEVVELSAVFPAGKSFEPEFGLATITSKMLQEGTRSKTGLEFAKEIEGIGGFISTETGYESASVNLTCLSRHLEKALDLLSEMVLDPAFEETEFRKLIDRTLHHLELQEQKTEFLARREFNTRLFGSSHPYGRIHSKENFLALDPKLSATFHKKNYSPSNLTILVAGKFKTEDLLKGLNKRFGQDKGAQNVSWDSSFAKEKLPLPGKGKFFVEKTDARQSSIMVGHRGFERRHPDYHVVDMAVTLFGGYFGSRLMKNIREEKGFTYGIYATWLSMKFGGTFLIQTDVGTEYTERTFEEIRKELYLFLEKGTRPEELDLVRNYKLGKLISGRETASQILDLLSTCFVNEIPFEDLNQKYERIRSLTDEEVVEMARKYFKPDDLLEVAAGGK